MSHEGIQTINPDELGSLQQQTRLTGEAIQPARVRVDKTGGTGVMIEWKDGHRSSWSFAWLRAACPCATCIEEREAQGLAPGQTAAKPALLPLYQDPARPLEVTPVGNYALRFKWNDGHESGIYSWDYLRNVADVEATRQKASTL
ncbi:MAG: DUF971 domain-containing protein [Acidobacteriaceae bacterium]